MAVDEKKKITAEKGGTVAREKRLQQIN